MANDHLLDTPDQRVTSAWRLVKKEILLSHASSFVIGSAAAVAVSGALASSLPVAGIGLGLSFMGWWATGILHSAVRDKLVDLHVIRTNLATKPRPE